MKEIPLPADVRAEDLTVSLVSAAGKELIRYQPTKMSPGPRPKPVQPPPGPADIKTTDELYQAGLRLEQFHSPALDPDPDDEEVLKRDPGDYRANVAMSILYLKRAEFDKAETHLQVAVDRATHNHTRPKDGEALYYLGVALRSQGWNEEAEVAFQRAAWSAAWYGPAHQALAELACGQDRYAQALGLVERAVTANGRNTKALDLNIAVLRKLGRLDEAEMLVKRVHQIDPIDHWVGNEHYLILKAKKGEAEAKQALTDLTSLMRGDTASYLELALDYANCHLDPEAVGVLERLIDSTPDQNKLNPLLLYYRAYFRQPNRTAVKWACFGYNISGINKTWADFQRAAKLPADYCFPFQTEAVEILSAAAMANPSDAKAHYYIGNLLFDLQPKDAILEWEKSRKRDPSFATVHRNLGLAYARIEHATDKAVASLERAVACDPKDSTLFAELDHLYEAANTAPAHRFEVLARNQEVIARRDDCLLREITLATFLGKHDRAVQLLDNHHFRLWEGESGTHDVYADAYLQRARHFLNAKQYEAALSDCQAVLEFPDRLETAKPERVTGKMVPAYYFLGLVHEAMGKTEQAQECCARSPAQGMMDPTAATTGPWRSRNWARPTERRGSSTAWSAAVETGFSEWPDWTFSPSSARGNRLPCRRPRATT